MKLLDDIKAEWEAQEEERQIQKDEDKWEEEQIEKQIEKEEEEADV